MALQSDELIPTRATLIQRLKNWDDQLSWQDFFDTYWKLIYNIAIKGGLTDSEAQDVVQETMISIAKHMPDFKYDHKAGSFKSWLLNMTRWRIADQLRRRQRLAASGPSPIDDANDTSSVERLPDPATLVLEPLWDAEWEKNLFDAAVVKVKRQLDPQKYQIFDFYVNKEWEAPKVAEMFGISVGQVYLAKHRVSEMIKSEVAQLRKTTS